MSLAGAFNDRARAAIYEAGGSRCIGCRRTDLSAQHRRPRGMGGTSDVTIGHPANGVPLCGDGVRGCHGWTENHPRYAQLLGWLLEPGQPALGTPFYTVHMGPWRAWAETDGWPHTVYVDNDDLDQLPEREAAVARYRVVRPLVDGTFTLPHVSG
jgi:hypothetical protein